MKRPAYILRFEEVSRRDVGSVGGKNASLGEMIRELRPKGIRVPGGFAATARLYWDFLKANRLEGRIREQLRRWKKKSASLETAGRAIRRMFLAAEFPEAGRREIAEAYRRLCREYRAAEADVAVRSSATAEDLPDASFAGQQETFLNIRGEEELLDACRRCYASLFTDRAIVYREEKGFPHMEVALSIGVQKMVRSDKAGSGVMFSIDTESGFPKVVRINAAWGLGETVVQGIVNPDEYLVFKPLLSQNHHKPVIDKTLGQKEKTLIYAVGGTKTTKMIDTPKELRQRFVLDDGEILRLARWAAAIEKHYGLPMDMEWAKDGRTGELFIVQARPETIHSRRVAAALKEYKLLQKGNVLVTGLSIGEAIAAGKVCKIKSAHDIGRFVEGSILVTEMTDPDWVPVMKKARGIVTDHGGRTCHAAIVSRELGIPAVVGTSHATRLLKDARPVTLSCAEGDTGYIYDGMLKFSERELDLKKIPETRTRIMMNIASPAAAMRWWRLPCKGIGLARMEFIVDNIIKVHPMALVRYAKLKDAAAKAEIAELTRGYRDKTEYFVEHLARGIAKIAAAQHPEPVVVRLSDFKTNEYANLIGGREFEPHEENPMIGWRGASRYYDDKYREGFALECRAIRRVREEMGLKNVVVMVPFCRTVEEADRVLAEMAKNGLKRGKSDLQIYVMCEIPSNVILADLFAKRFDGFSIGSNDLTQLTLGVDRDSADLARLFDERNAAVTREIAEVIRAAHRCGVKVGICGQAPSDYPDFARFLVRCGIDSISLNPDSVLAIKKIVAAEEKKLTADQKASTARRPTESRPRRI